MRASSGFEHTVVTREAPTPRQPEGLGDAAGQRGYWTPEAAEGYASTGKRDDCASVWRTLTAHEGLASWRFLVYDTQGKQILAHAIDKDHAQCGIGLQGRPNWTYHIKLRRSRGGLPLRHLRGGLGDPGARDPLGRQRPEPHRPEVMIGLKDWEHMRAFL